MHFEVEETKAIRKFCSRLQREIELLPTLDEKEIIRKAFERVVEILEKEKSDWNYDYNVPLDNAIKIIKEECGISE